MPTGPETTAWCEIAKVEQLKIDTTNLLDQGFDKLAPAPANSRPANARMRRREPGPTHLSR